MNFLFYWVIQVTYNIENADNNLLSLDFND